MITTDEPYVEVAGIQLPSRLLDSYEVHRAALAHDLDVLALPRQVLLAGKQGAVPADISFTHGVPEASDLAAVTFAQDIRLRRALMGRADVPKPRGASFTWRSLERAQRWVERLGEAAVAKEGVGENPPREIRHISTPDALLNAFRKLRLREAADRTPGSNPYVAGYATTRLTFTHDEDGNEVAPLRSRLIVEEDVPGRVIRAFVVDGKIVAAVKLDEDRQTAVEEVTETLNTTVSDIFIGAAESIPGLASATVDLVVNGRAEIEPGREYLVIGLAERPRMETFMTADPEIATRIGDAIVDFQARTNGLQLGAQVSKVERSIEIEGLRHAERLAEELPQIAASHGAELTVTSVDNVAGNISATASGSPETLAALMELLMAGSLTQDRAAAVNYVKGLHQ